MFKSPIITKEDIYERVLDESTFRLYMDILVKLPLRITTKGIELNMITIKKNKEIVFQIYREIDTENEFTISPGGKIDPKTFSLKKKYFKKKNKFKYWINSYRSSKLHFLSF